jgi:carboxyl-terminal processing protease
MLYRSLLSKFVSFVILGIAAGGAHAQTIAKEAKDEVLAAVQEILFERAFVPTVDLRKWPDYVEKQREAIDQAEREADFITAVNRALREFGISHVRLRSPAAAQARNRTSVIGVGLSARSEREGLVVTNVMANSPAAAAGVRQGDRIVLVDGKAPESPDVLSGESGSDVTIVVRNEAGEERELTLKRQSISTVRPETLRWLDDETAVLRIWTFSRGYDRDNIESLMRQANEKATYLVLDLRSNGGGAVNNLQHLLSLLMPHDTVAGTFISRAEARRYSQATQVEELDPVAIATWSDRKYRTSRRPVAAFEGKIAVLINRGSASASEICAAALKENRDAVLVGSRTAGAVLASIFGRLPHGFEIQYPVSDYVTAQGVRLEGNPVQPQIEVTAQQGEEGDVVLQRAVEALKAKASDRAAA